MISSLQGTIRSLNQERVILEIGGVGFAISIAANTSQHLNIGTQVILHTSLVVREDSLTLYGFLDEESKTLFELLQTVSGIGPKVALAILGSLTPDQLYGAIASEDIKSLELVPGIGHKGAQRMILELKGKLSDPARGSSVIRHQPQWREQVSAALVSLGYSAREADSAMNQLVESALASHEDIDNLEISEILKRSLQNGRKR